MPWYKVALSFYVSADAPDAAQDAVLAMLPDGADVAALYPQELTAGQEEAHLQLREILRQAKEDRAAGNMVSSPGYPGLQFSPQAAAELAAMEFEVRMPPLEAPARYRNITLRIDK